MYISTDTKCISIYWLIDWLVFDSVRVMVFNATFNNISAISWRSVLLVEETGVPRENHRPVTNHWQTLSHNVVFFIKIRAERAFWYSFSVSILRIMSNFIMGHRGHDRMVVGFTITYAISAYHHKCCDFEYQIQCYTKRWWFSITNVSIFWYIFHSRVSIFERAI
jgi:hypothetical protein